MRTFDYRDIVAFEKAVEDSADVAALQNALQRARDAGVPSHRIKSCEEVLMQAEKDTLHLQTAMDGDDVAALHSAIRAIQKSSKLLKSEIGQAQRHASRLATQELETAVSSKDIATIEAAIDRCKIFLHDQAVLLNAQRVLSDLRVSRAVIMLSEAVQSKDIANLEVVIFENSTLLGHHPSLLEAKQMLVTLKTEQSLREVRMAMDGQNVEELEVSIEKNSALLGEHSAILDAQASLLSLKRNRALKELAEVMELVTAEIPQGFVSHGRLARLRAAIDEGERLGIDPALISSANEARADARACLPGCAVCLDAEKDVSPLPCCGRIGGSNMLCDECVTTLAALHATCPFCRKARVKRR